MEFLISLCAFILLLAGLYLSLKFGWLLVQFRVPKSTAWTVGAILTAILLTFRSMRGLSIYLFMTFVIGDGIALCIKKKFDKNIKKWTNLSAIIFTFLCCIYGYFHAKDIDFKAYDIVIEKSTSNLRNLKVVLATDMHLGESIKTSELDAIIARINAIEPDIILLGGDIYDENTPKDLEEYSLKVWHKLKSKYGIYYVGGNHEHRVLRCLNKQHIFSLLPQNGVNVLEDKSVLIDDAFYLVGREDIYSGSRMPLAELTKTLDKHRPLILLEHQPIEFSIAEKLGVDLILCGHTHKGQIFPVELLIKLFSKNGFIYGYKKYNMLQVVISSGAGTWGFPMRIGTNSEIVILNIKFENKKLEKQ